MNRRLQWVMELIDGAVKTLQGWGGGQGLREVGLKRDRVSDPYLVWAYPQARHIVFTAMMEASPVLDQLPEEYLKLARYIYREALTAGIEVPRGFGEAMRRAGR